jgi:hypothetical protein
MMENPCSKLRTATRRAKSDVANKLVSMFLHELSRKIGQGQLLKIESEEYEQLVRETFGSRCPYCSRDLVPSESVIEHLDAMNRSRAGLHLPGNVLVACRRCNNEKRRDDALTILSLAGSGWESFLCHDGTRCVMPCRTCLYWESVWPDKAERASRLGENLTKLQSFRRAFSWLGGPLASINKTRPELLTRLYSDCQMFAEREIRVLLETIK